MLHPNQFQVNEAWVAFKLNGDPIHTERDGDFNFLALMDAASCFILSTTPLVSKQPEPTLLESRHLLKEGLAHNTRWPITLLLPAEGPARFLAAEAERLGICVVRVALDQPVTFIGDAQETFCKRFDDRVAQ